MDYFDELPAGIRNHLTALSKAEAKRAAAILAVDRAAVRARSAGASWGWIAACLGTSRQAAWSKYGKPDADVDDDEDASMV